LGKAYTYLRSLATTTTCTRGLSGWTHVELEGARMMTILIETRRMHLLVL